MARPVRAGREGRQREAQEAARERLRLEGMLAEVPTIDGEPEPEDDARAVGE